MMIKLLPQSVKEIRREYPDQWVVLSDLKRDEHGNLLSGVVLSASSDQRDVYARSKEYARNGFREIVFWQTSQEAPTKAIAS